MTFRLRMRDRLLAALAILGFLLICFAAAASRRPGHPPPPVSYGAPKSVVRTEQAAQDDLSGRPPKPSHLAVPHWLIMDLLYLGLAIVFGLLVLAIVKIAPYLSFEQRRRRRVRKVAEQDEATPDFDRETQNQLARTFTDALTGFDVGDGNRSIVACWIRLEQIAEGVGFARQSWETSTELITRWLSRTSLPVAALNQLAELYREARYSGRPMSKGQLESARAALTELRIAFQPLTSRNSTPEDERVPGHD